MFLAGWRGLGDGIDGAWVVGEAGQGGQTCRYLTYLNRAMKFPARRKIIILCLTSGVAIGYSADCEV